MAENAAIRDNVQQIRKAVYGKDVREAIASGLEICYGYTSGDAANQAANRANTAAEAAEGIISRSEAAVEQVEDIIENADAIVKVSETQPTEPENKIWIQPQVDTEYKVASWAAYEALWTRMNEIDETYQQGHGGVVSITLDEDYYDSEDLLKKKYVITYSDGTEGVFYVHDGQTGNIGPTDIVDSYEIMYAKAAIDPSTGRPAMPPAPASDSSWGSNPPALSGGDYLWTRTKLTYESEAYGFIYCLSRQGLDGSGAVDSVKLGSDGIAQTGAVVLPVDSAPTANSTNLVLSGAIKSAIDAVKASPAFTGEPTAPTPESGDSSTKIATTAFVNNAITEGIDTELLFANAALTGTPTAPTASEDDDSTQIANTEFVRAIANSIAANKLAGLHIYTFEKESNANSYKYLLGIPKYSNHLILCAGYRTTDCALFLAYSSSNGTVSLLKIAAGSSVTLEANYTSSGSSVVCGLRLSTGGGGRRIYVYDIPLFLGGEWANVYPDEDTAYYNARVRETPAEAQTALSV